MTICLPVSIRLRVFHAFHSLMGPRIVAKQKVPIYTAIWSPVPNIDPRPPDPRIPSCHSRSQGLVKSDRGTRQMRETIFRTPTR